MTVLVEVVLPIFLAVMALTMATFFGGLLAGWIGWGGWVLAGAVIWLFFPPLTALIAAQPIVLAIDGLLFAKNRELTDWALIKKLLLLSIPGLLLGLLAIAFLPNSVLYALAGVLLLAALLPAIWKRAPLQFAAFFGGLFTTAGGFNGPPLAIGVRDLPQRARLGTLGALFIILAALALPLIFLVGGSKEEALQGIVVGVSLSPVALLGTWVAIKNPPEERYLIYISQAVVALAAVLLLLKAISISF